MKKIILTLALMFAIGTANAQEGGLKLGIHAAIPTGDIKDLYSFGLGLDIAYLWPVADQFKAGIASGYSHYMGKEIETGFGTFEVEDAGFIPIAATGHFSFTENFFGAMDLGYAIGVAPSGNDGGFLYQPKIGYQNAKIEVYGGYKGISVDGGTFSSINFGVNYKL